MSPYKRYQPVSEEEMNKRMKNDNTICNFLRAIYHATTEETIRLKCRLAFAMGKSMCNKLMYYHETFEPLRNGFNQFLAKEPAPESDMDIKRWEGHHSICQTIRDMYHLTDDSDIRMKCRIAMAMTKAMNNRLQYYKHVYIEHIPHPNNPFEESKNESNGS